MKHTKWVTAKNIKIGAATYEQGILELPNGSEPQLVAVVYDDEVALLISKAPEMYEALKEIVNAQYNPKKTLANMNSTISEAAAILKDIDNH